MPDEVKKRGRPPLSSDEKAKSAERRKQYIREYHAARPEIYRNRFYEPKLRIPVENRDVLQALLDETSLSITELFAGAVEEKYGVRLINTIDKKRE